MADKEMSWEELLAEIDKRIKAATDALKTELLAEIAKKQDTKEKFKVFKREGAAS